MLIIHVDDAGTSLEHNSAITEACLKGLATSASVIIDKPSSENFLRSTNIADLGLHFAIDCAFVSDRDRVESLLEKQYLKMKFLRNPTHLDTHGGVIFRSEVSLETYVRFSKRFLLPALVCKNERMNSLYPGVQKVLNDYEFPVLDDILMSPAKFNLDDKLDWVLNKLGQLSPGFYQWIVHPSNTVEGSSDLWILKHIQLKRLLYRRRFVLTTWSEVWNRFLDS